MRRFHFNRILKTLWTCQSHKRKFTSHARFLGNKFCIVANPQIDFRFFYPATNINSMPRNRHKPIKLYGGRANWLWMQSPLIASHRTVTHWSNKHKIGSHSFYHPPCVAVPRKHLNIMLRSRFILNLDFMDDLATSNNADWNTMTRTPSKCACVRAPDENAWHQCNLRIS